MYLLSSTGRRQASATQQGQSQQQCSAALPSASATCWPWIAGRGKLTKRRTLRDPLAPASELPPFSEAASATSSRICDEGGAQDRTGQGPLPRVDSTAPPGTATATDSDTRPSARTPEPDTQRSREHVTPRVHAGGDPPRTAALALPPRSGVADDTRVHRDAREPSHSAMCLSKLQQSAEVWHDHCEAVAQVTARLQQQAAPPAGPATTVFVQPPATCQLSHQNLTDQHQHLADWQGRVQALASRLLATRVQDLAPGPPERKQELAPGLLTSVAASLGVRRTQSAGNGASLAALADIGGADEPRAARAVPASETSIPNRRESENSDVYEDPLLRRNGSLRRGLNVNTTTLQEAVRIGLEAAASAQSKQDPPEPPPELDMKLRTLKISELSAELSGLAMIGRGGGGMVFRALWQGALVAAKFMPGETAAGLNMGALEGMLAASVHHPNIVQTYGFDVTRVLESSFELPHGREAGASEGRICSSDSLALIVKGLDEESARIQSLASLDDCCGYLSSTPPMESFLRGSHAGQPVRDPLQRFNSEDGFGEPTEVPPDSWTLQEVLQELDMRPGMYMTHIIMELCDRGSLLSALKQGVFRVGGASRDSLAFHDRVVLRAALRTARDVARGMQHLHAAGIIHGDLKPGNVLLKGSRTDRRGFVAKLADFGLSKVVTGDAPLAMKHWSTVAYMAPEGIRGVWCKQSDVYSFGVLLWQLMTGEPEAFKGLTAMQVLLGASRRRLRLHWPAHCNTAAAQLGEACMAYDPRLRPTFQEIGDVLVRIEQNIRDEVMMASRACSRDASNASTSWDTSGPTPRASP